MFEAFDDVGDCIFGECIWFLFGDKLLVVACVGLPGVGTEGSLVLSGPWIDEGVWWWNGVDFVLCVVEEVIGDTFSFYPIGYPDGAVAFDMALFVEGAVESDTVIGEEAAKDVVAGLVHCEECCVAGVQELIG